MTRATLDLAEVRRRPVRMVRTPGPSLFALAADVAGAGRGVPVRWVTAARARLEPIDLAALAPIGARSGGYVPGCLTMSGDRPPAHGAEAVERIASLPVEELLDDVRFVFGSSPPAPWDRIVRQPRRWLLRYARATARVWKAMREPWEAAGELFEREAERIRTAMADGTLPELVATLHHDGRVDGERWRLPCDEAHALRLPDRGLRLTPVLAGPGAARIEYGHDARLISILYPLPGVPRLVDGQRRRPGDELRALIGAQRATVLRLLDRPRPMGQLARALRITPSAVTHHVSALEASDLLVRERSGRFVVVGRTPRGTALLALYKEP